MSSSKDMIESRREIVQDLLAPELKAAKVSVASLQHEISISIEALRQEIKLSNEAIRQQMRLGDKMIAQAIRELGKKIDYAINVRERLAVVEARLPHE